MKRQERKMDENANLLTTEALYRSAMIPGTQSLSFDITGHGSGESRRPEEREKIEDEMCVAGTIGIGTRGAIGHGAFAFSSDCGDAGKESMGSSSAGDRELSAASSDKSSGEGDECDDSWEDAGAKRVFGGLKEAMIIEDPNGAAYGSYQSIDDSASSTMPTKVQAVEASSPPIQEPKIIDRVNFSAMTPPRVRKELTFPLHVWAYLKRQRALMLEKARKLGTTMESGRQSGVSVPRGSEVVAELRVDAACFEVDGRACKVLWWDGDVTHLEFSVRCIREIPGHHLCHVFLYVSGTLLAIVHVAVCIVKANEFDSVVVTDAADHLIALLDRFSPSIKKISLPKSVLNSVKCLEKLQMAQQSAPGAPSHISSTEYLKSIFACYSEKDADFVKQWKDRLLRFNADIEFRMDSGITKKSAEYSAKMKSIGFWQGFDLCQMFWTVNATCDAVVEMQWRNMVSAFDAENKITELVDFLQVLRIDSFVELPADLAEFVLAHKAYSDSLQGKAPLAVPTTETRKQVEDPKTELQIYARGLNENTVQVGEYIGGGNFGGVYMASRVDPNPATPENFVVKILKFEPTAGKSDMNLVSLAQEAALARTLSNFENVVAFYGAHVSRKKQELWLFYEYMTGGSLHSVLMTGRASSWSDKWQIALQVARGVAQLHSACIVHRDLAARNFLMSSDMSLVKVTDFGMSMSVSHPVVFFVDPSGSPLKWMAPEALVARMFSFKSDIYALAIVLWEIASDGEAPYASLSAREAAVGVVKRGLRPECPIGTPTAYAQLLDRCWSSDIEARPSADDVVAAIEAAMPR